MQQGAEGKDLKNPSPIKSFLRGEKMFYTTLQSPVGELYIAEESGKIVFISFEKANVEKGREKQTPLLSLAERQLTEYFDGARKTFDLPLNPSGTEFYKRVWKALEEIPYGETRSYKQIAEAVGAPKACRAVGGANHNNPIVIVLPCHRVIGAQGKLTGYGGGLDKKEYLLSLERRY